MTALICAVVFSQGIVRDISREDFTNYYRNVSRNAPPYVVFPCIMTDMEAYRFYARHDPQMRGDYDPQRGMYGQ